MKKFIISVNGKKYEVEVEEINGGGSVAAQGTTLAPKTQTSVGAKPQPSIQKPAAQPKKEVQAKPVPEGAETVEAPMPGTVLDIKVNEGDTVTAGQVLVILEAMKMENEIVAPRNGKVTAINTTKGASVNTGDALISLQ